MWDVLIIGAGTAGLTAAVYASRAGRSVMVLEGRVSGGQIINTPEIQNYPGILRISGYEFADNLRQQALSFGASIEDADVLRVERKDGRFILHAGRRQYEGRTAIIASGSVPRSLGLENEQRLTGAGVSYCATCDGAFFRDRDVAVMGGGNTAVGDALFLSRLCRQVYLVHRRQQFRASAHLVEQLRSHKNITLMLDGVITALIGQQSLSAVEVSGVADRSKQILPVSGLFIAIGQIPRNEVFSDLVSLDSDGYIAAGEDCMTGVPGLFVAGDCRVKKVRQLVTAAADGAVAAIAALDYLM